ncbi:STAS domain-containing protein [Undibacterium sp. RTI2.1]|uniref:STAS domain-containing protein n=1 Tax=unclassified Undibacterium TaxID=2630295 RepID=UPI002AB36868|nr:MULTISPECIES: STAS domain-containing protein [unclassified Undibacterium]MDY7540038.1 STAS domain-containing protein [Undibacterium sp. 5I1]MEB0031578.1 STAS domain-containing protein [Undibacterium sp. RTI2.1]MEB0117852.1 STAS domain-containing protein [Undibacterium sp. RTI2.2]MEB0232968.1 STAS domain-containing protein [Undibacterium sp. 10I3]MEB0257885.1 STAS domain-containing protein [Undibacterium sp. 5I1]
MGIFSLFGKKNGQQEKDSALKTSAKKTRSKSGNTDILATSGDETPSNSIMAQRHVARATARKIDAIEFEMSRDMVKSKSVAPNKTVPDAKANATNKSSRATEQVTDFQSTLPLAMPTTDYLLEQHTDLMTADLAETESVPLLEEAAILFASGQKEVAEQMLQAAIHNRNLGQAEQIGWYMLFDLYEISNNQVQFDRLSLEYASKYEMSPPIWHDSRYQSDTSDEDDLNQVTANISFPAQLDGSIIKLLERLQQASTQSQSLKLDFTRVKSVDAVGCGLLLRALRNLKKTKHDLMLVAAQDLADNIRAILQVGRRDETEAPWLLLLEILQLLHFEKAFEEVSMDYCITFEVSPPSFEAPKNKVTTSFPEVQLETESAHRFMMPAVIEGKTDILIAQITEHSKLYNQIILDCSRLERVEFGASAQLLNGLVPIAGVRDNHIQFVEVNYLVMALFNAMGLKSVATIFPRKH